MTSNAAAIPANPNAMLGRFMSASAKTSPAVPHQNPHLTGLASRTAPKARVTHSSAADVRNASSEA